MNVSGGAVLVSPTLLRPESSSSFLMPFDANLAFRRGFSGPAKRKHSTFAYNINDSINLLAQNGATTSFTYDAENRRLNETTNSVTTTRHYTNQSDNPTFTTQTVQSVTKTEHYTPTLGSNLNIITTTDGTTKTANIQLQDMRGNTATTINLDTNIASSWCSFDEFGNQTASNPQSTNLINYSTYAQAQRATNNTTGLILMGARVYNPITNQFTSPDPVKGGNENPYTYPNNPIGHSDFTGLIEFNQDQMNALALLIDVGVALLSIALCGLNIFICYAGSVALSVLGDVLTQEIDLHFGPASRRKGSHMSITSIITSAVIGAVSPFVGRIAGAGLSKLLLRSLHLEEKVALDVTLSNGLKPVVGPVVNSWLPRGQSIPNSKTGGAGLARMVMQ